MFENFTIPAGFSEVAQADLQKVLVNCGNRSFVHFFENDEIVVSEKVLSHTFKLEDGKDSKPVYDIVVSLNDRTRVLPLGTFRRFPKQYIDALTTPIMRQLYNATDDYERFDLLRNKTLVVKSLVDGETIDWQKSTDTERVYKQAKFAIFDLK